ncbi:MAG: hypothetical protein HY687_05160 [Chloroflexi bacterium]|nr:hypothetical protein [Chloroflexota bacterium]
MNIREHPITVFTLVLVFYVLLSIMALRGFIFEPGTLGHHWDWNVPPPVEYLRNMAETAFYGWSEVSLGHSRYSFPNFFVFIYASWGFLGLSGDFVSKFWLFFAIFFSGISMFYLVKNILVMELGARTSYRVYASSLLAGIGYALSPYLFNEILGGASSQYIVYSLLPLALYIVKRMVAEGPEFKYVFALGLMFLFISSAFQSLLLFSAIILIYIFFKPKRRASLWGLVKAYGLFILFDAQWLIQASQVFFGSMSALTTSEQLQLVRLSGGNIPTISQAFLNTGYFNPLFTSSITPSLMGFWVITSFALVIITFSALFLIPSQRNKQAQKEVIFWTALFLASLVLATGGHPPLGDFVVWLYTYFPPMVLFRSVQHFIEIPTLALSILIGMGTYFLISYLRRPVILLVPFALTFIWVHPFLTGDWGALNLRAAGFNAMDNFQLSPGYKKILKKISADNDDFKVLMLPMALSPFFNETEYQKQGQGSDPLVVNAPYPVITADFPVYSYEKEYGDLLEAAFSSPTIPRTATNLLSKANIKYIMVRKDVQANFGPVKYAFDWAKTENALEGIVGMEKVEGGDWASLWEYKDYQPRIFGVNNLTYVPGTSKDLARLMAGVELPSRLVLFQDKDRFEANGKSFASATALDKELFAFVNPEGVSQTTVIADFEGDNTQLSWSSSGNFEPTNLKLSTTTVKSGKRSLEAFFDMSLNRGAGAVDLKFDRPRDFSGVATIHMWTYYPDIPPANAGVTIMLGDDKWQVLFQNRVAIRDQGWNEISTQLPTSFRGLEEVRFIRFQLYELDLNKKSATIYFDDVALSTNMKAGNMNFDFEDARDLQHWTVDHNFLPGGVTVDETIVKQGKRSLKAFYDYSYGTGGGSITLEFSALQKWDNPRRINFWLYFPGTPPPQNNIAIILADDHWDQLEKYETTLHEGWNNISFLSAPLLNSVRYMRIGFTDANFDLMSKPIYLDDVKIETTTIIGGKEYNDGTAMILPAGQSIEILTPEVRKAAKYTVALRIKPSQPGEMWLEDVNRKYVKSISGDDMAWFTLSGVEIGPKTRSLILSANVNVILDELVIRLQQDLGEHVDPIISAQRVSPVSSKVHVQTKEPFFLVLTESFDGGWGAYYGDAGWLGIPSGDKVDDTMHFKVNGFANAWYIKKAGEYDITLYFEPQRIYTFAWAISSGALLFSLLYLTRGLLRRLLGRGHAGTR